jgi:hypothetical protein
MQMDSNGEGGYPTNMQYPGSAIRATKAGAS